MKWDWEPRCALRMCPGRTGNSLMTSTHLFSFAASNEDGPCSCQFFTTPTCQPLGEWLPAVPAFWEVPMSPVPNRDICHHHIGSWSPGCDCISLYSEWQYAGKVTILIELPLVPLAAGSQMTFLYLDCHSIIHIWSHVHVQTSSTCNVVLTKVVW